MAEKKEKTTGYVSMTERGQTWYFNTYKTRVDSRGNKRGGQPNKTKVSIFVKKPLEGMAPTHFGAILKVFSSALI